LRKLIVTNIVSLDGYYEGPNKNWNDLPANGLVDDISENI
jgi:hypothetical protein